MAVIAAKVASAVVVAIATGSNLQNNLNKRRESTRRFFVQGPLLIENIIFVANYFGSC